MNWLCENDFFNGFIFNERDSLSYFNAAIRPTKRLRLKGS